MSLPPADTTTKLTIGTLAAAAGVTVETIRFYQRKHLLPEPARAHRGIRHYGDGDLARVGFIKSAQRLGFSLAEVADLLQLQDGTHCSAARVVAESKLAQVRAKLAELRRIESALADLVRDCASARGDVHCPLIGSLRHG
jgi:MerR family mercuric resistance operon transcriptional regulator